MRADVELASAVAVRLTDGVLARALLALRIVGLAVALFVIVEGYDEAMARPQAAYVAFAAMAGWTGWLAYTATVRPADAFRPLALIIELTIAAGAVAADGWAVHPVITWQIPVIGGLWVLATPAAVGIGRGPLLGAAAGGALGLSRLLSDLAPPEMLSGVYFTLMPMRELPRLVPSVVLVATYVTVGAGVGYLAQRLRAAEAELATVQARQDVSRALHDGVIQTLALIGAKASDPTHARLAREAERDLRSFLFGSSPGTAKRTEPLAGRLREAGLDFARRADLDPQFVLAPDLPSVGPQLADAVTGMVAEALANVAKHAQARRVVIYAAPEERSVGSDVSAGVTVTVSDDGLGFDPTRVNGNGQGLRLSIIERAQRVGGIAEISSTPGEGTEVSLWIPSAS
jgi:signal transduction histidine kinase